MPTEHATLPRSRPAPAFASRQHSVLIIDDDEGVSNVLAHCLKQQGFRTVAVGSAAAGLARAKSDPPSAVILDLGLPDADGLAVCEQLADMPETCGVPIIVLSGRDGPGLVRRCRAAGCHYFLRKPYDPGALLVLLREAIRQASLWDEELLVS